MPDSDPNGFGNSNPMGRHVSIDAEHQIPVSTIAYRFANESPLSSTV